MKPREKNSRLLQPLPVLTLAVLPLTIMATTAGLALKFDGNLRIAMVFTFCIFAARLLDLYCEILLKDSNLRQIRVGHAVSDEPEMDVRPTRTRKSLTEGPTTTPAATQLTDSAGKIEVFVPRDGKVAKPLRWDFIPQETLQEFVADIWTAMPEFGTAGKLTVRNAANKSILFALELNADGVCKDRRTLFESGVRAGMKLQAEMSQVERSKQN